MLELVTTLMIGFSVLAAAILLFAYLGFLPDMQKSAVSRVACSALLGTVAGLQLYHLRFLMHGTAPIDSAAYATLLLAAPPAFYFFSREVLLPGQRHGAFDLVHLAPLLFATVLPPRTLAPVAFFIGTGYAFWFTRVVWGMRRQRARFRFEMFFFTLFALLALVVLVLGLALPYLDPAVFYLGYANAIGVALLLVTAALIVFPDLLGDISDAARATYAASTLGNVDVDAAIDRLGRLMRDGRIYEDESLNLAALAEALDLSPHQLSELINTRFGVGFSRYLREQRVAAARTLLVQDSRASVLSVGMATGFRSQSNFYAAFREITGETPGNYRKRQLRAPDDS